MFIVHLADTLTSNRLGNVTPRLRGNEMSKLTAMIQERRNAIYGEASRLASLGIAWDSLESFKTCRANAMRGERNTLLHGDGARVKRATNVKAIFACTEQELAHWLRCEETASVAA
jgi:hypothetical protein